MKRASLMVAAAMLVAGPVQARAQVGSGGVLLSLAIFGPTVACVLGEAVHGTTERNVFRGPAPENGHTAEIFLRENVFAVEESLSSGHGAFLDDLAAGLEIRQANRSRFGRLLRAHRRDLLALADPALLTPDRAVAFFEKVRAVATTDEALRADIREAAGRRGFEVAAR